MPYSPSFLQSHSNPPPQLHLQPLTSNVLFLMTPSVVFVHASIWKDKKVKLLDHCLRFRFRLHNQEKENGKRRDDNDSSRKPIDKEEEENTDQQANPFHQIPIHLVVNSVSILIKDDRFNPPT
ncbi:hypothetical protein L1887_35802 [Cichorium endivia]|nr:hypothetical protein L1887_35802 [Cichorium endivia]